jgi:uncharacterized repeat protein (TIGR01451 family)
VHEGDCSAIEFGETPTQLLGVDTQSGFYRFNVFNTGAKLLDYTGGVIGSRQDFRYLGGRIYCTDGAVVDVTSKTRLASLPANGWLVGDPVTSEVVYLLQAYPQYILTGFSTSTLTPAWAYVVPGVSNLAGNLVRCGTGIYAFRTVESQVVIVNSAHVPRTPTVDLETYFDPATSAGPVDAPFTIVGIVRNHGPAPAQNVVVTNTFSPGTVLQSFSTAHGACTNVNGMLACTLGHLPPGGAASFVLTVLKTNAGLLTVSATSSADLPDPVTTNSTGRFTAEITAVPPPPPPDEPVPPTDLSVRESFVINPAGRISYQLIVSNAGPAVATNVNLTDFYPAGAAVVSANATTGFIATEPGYVRVWSERIAPGGVVLATVVVDSPSDITWINRAEVSSSAEDLYPADNDTISVIGPGGLGLVTKLALPAADLIYDDVHRRLYASVGPEGGALSNSVVAIDPDSAAIVQQIPVGQSVGKLALSAQSRYVYAALTETGAVLRLDPVANKIDERIPLAVGRRAFGLAALPMDPLSLAVSTSAFPTGEDPGIEIYDGTVRRPDKVAIEMGVGFFFVHGASSADRLYANGYGGFHIVPISPTGVNYPGTIFPGIPPDGTDFVVAGRTAFFHSGHVVDLEAQMVLANFAFPPGFVAPDLAANRIYFLPQNGRLFPGSDLEIRAFDAVMRSNLWNLSLPTPPRIERGLIGLRSGELALFTEGPRGSVLLLRTGPLEIPTANVALLLRSSPQPIGVDGTISYPLSVFNLGPWGVTNVVVTNALPPGTVFVSATANAGACSLADGTVICVFDALPPKTGADLSIVVRVPQAGTVTNQFGMAHPFSDPDLANNSLVVTTAVYPVPSLNISDAAVLEGRGRTSILFRVSLSTVSSRPVTARYATTDGTAVAGVDYDALSGLIVFPPNATNAIITTLQGIRGNSTVESNRYFFVDLLNPTNAVPGRSRARGFIIEDDFNWITVGTSNHLEGNSGRTDATFSLTLAAPSPQAVSIGYSVVNGTAMAGKDYSPRAGTYIFSPGATNGVLRLSVLGDFCTEADETYFVQLFPTDTGLPRVAEATGTILNDDSSAALAIVAIEPVADGWRVTFPTACDRFYRLQRSESLEVGSWTLVGDAIAGTGQPMQATDRNNPSGKQAFYRIELVP